MGEVADLFGTLGLKVNEAEWSKGDQIMARAVRAVNSLSREAERESRRVEAANARQAAASERAHRRSAAEAQRASASAAAAAERAASRTEQAFGRAGAAIKLYAAYLVGNFAYDRLIKFNQTVQDETISLAAVIEGNLGTSFEEAKGKAADLYKEFQKFSTQTPVTTQEILQFGKAIAASTFQTGGTIKDLQLLSEQGVIASKVLAGNRGAGYAQIELSEMLMGMVSNRMMFARQLLGFVHMTEEQFRDLNAKQRLEVIKSALNSKAMQDAAKGFSTSFSGVTSTFEDKLQIAFGKVGAPLFDKLTKAIGALNVWLDANAEKIERVGKAVGEWLGEAFDTVSAAIGVVVEKGGVLLDWLGNFLDGGELLKSFIIAIGALLTAFALQMVIAFASNPITLIVLGVTALIYALRQLMNYPGGIKQAFADAWAAIGRAAGALWDELSEIGDRIVKFFVDDIPDAMLDAFKAAFEAIGDLPVVKQIVWVFKTAGAFGHMLGGGSGDDAIDATVTAPSASYRPSATLGAATGSGVSIGQVSVGDIHVQSPNADPVAVADEVRKTFHQELGNVLRSTMDQVS